jgi:hypothetical protein
MSASSWSVESRDYELGGKTGVPEFDYTGGFFSPGCPVVYFHQSGGGCSKTKPLLTDAISMCSVLVFKNCTTGDAMCLHLDQLLLSYQLEFRLRRIYLDAFLEVPGDKVAVFVEFRTSVNRTAIGDSLKTFGIKVLEPIKVLAAGGETGTLIFRPITGEILTKNPDGHSVSTWTCPELSPTLSLSGAGAGAGASSMPFSDALVCDDELSRLIERNKEIFELKETLLDRPNITSFRWIQDSSVDSSFFHRGMKILSHDRSFDLLVSDSNRDKNFLRDIFQRLVERFEDENFLALAKLMSKFIVVDRSLDPLFISLMSTVLLIPDVGLEDLRSFIGVLDSTPLTGSELFEKKKTKILNRIRDLDPLSPSGRDPLSDIGH